MTKKEYLTKMVEECLDVKVRDYDGSTNPVAITVPIPGKGVLGKILVQVQNHHGLTLEFWTGDVEFDPEDAQRLRDWMTKHGAEVLNTVNSKYQIVFKCEEYPWKCYAEPKAKEQPKAEKIFKPGTKVRFTQEAKDRFDDSDYWHSANYSGLNLDGVYTIESYSNSDWPSYSLKEKDTAPYIADYLLEEVPEEKEQPKSKPEVTEIIRLKEENRELKAKIQELEAKLKDQKEEPEQVKVHLFRMPSGIGFRLGFGW